jgi:hypothetical protein
MSLDQYPRKIPMLRACKQLPNQSTPSYALLNIWLGGTGIA